MRTPLKVLIATTVVMTPGVAACTEPVACGCSVYPSATKAFDGTLRHDLAPLLTRWPALAGATNATWASGTTGDARVPGPSTYWIDAVVTLPAEQVRRLATANTVTEPATPSVVEPLRPHLPDETVTGPALRNAFTLAGWQTSVYLSVDDGKVVVSAVGG